MDREAGSGLTSLEDQLNRGPVSVVPISEIVVADSPRRGGADDDHVAVLAESVAKLPPIVVHRRTMKVIDGAHRVQAAIRRGESTIEVRFFDGAEDDSFVLSVKANISHGLPLSRDDRVAAAERIIATHSHWSDRVIASVTGLAPNTIGAVRRSLGAKVTSPEVRVGRDGRVRPVDTARGRETARRLIAQNPGASLREIAAAAGVSPGTVRSVRRRMRLGEAEDRDRTTRRPREYPPEVDRDLILRNLQKDPSLRFTETGRTVLRLLDLHTLSEGECDRIVGAIPAHCLAQIAQLARSCGDMWHRFAEALERRQGAGS